MYALHVTGTLLSVKTSLDGERMQIGELPTFHKNFSTLVCLPKWQIAEYQLSCDFCVYDEHFKGLSCEFYLVLSHIMLGHLMFGA